MSGGEIWINERLYYQILLVKGLISLSPDRCLTDLRQFKTICIRLIYEI